MTSPRTPASCAALPFDKSHQQIVNVDAAVMANCSRRGLFVGNQLVIHPATSLVAAAGLKVEAATSGSFNVEGRWRARTSQWPRHHAARTTAAVVGVGQTRCHGTVAGDRQDARPVGPQRGLADLGAPDLQLRKAAVLEALDQHQVAVLHAAEQVVQRRLVGAAQLVHQRPAVVAEQQHLLQPDSRRRYESLPGRSMSMLLWLCLMSETTSPREGVRAPAARAAWSCPCRSGRRCRRLSWARRSCTRRAHSAGRVRPEIGSVPTLNDTRDPTERMANRVVICPRSMLRRTSRSQTRVAFESVASTARSSA